MELIFQSLIAIGGVGISILVATAKAKAVAKVTAEETAKAELNKIKAQKWWDKKVALYEKYVISIRKQIGRSLELADLIEDAKEKNNAAEILKTKAKEHNKKRIELSEDLQLGQFYFSEQSKDGIEKYFKGSSKIWNNKNRSSSALNEIYKQDTLLLYDFLTDMKISWVTK